MFVHGGSSNHAAAHSNECTSTHCEPVGAEPQQPTSWLRMRIEALLAPRVALDLIPQIECSNTYALRLRNPGKRRCSACTAHRFTPKITADDSRIARCVALINRQSAFQARQVHLPGHLSCGGMPLAAFVVEHATGYQPKARTRRDCLATHSPDAMHQLLFAAHSRTAAFQSPGRPTPGTGHHSGRRTASRFRCSRRLCIHVAIRSYPEGLKVVCTRLPSGHSLRSNRCDFWGQNQEAPPYPSTQSFAFRHRLYTNSLVSPMCSGLSSLSYSPSSISPDRRSSQTPVPLVAKSEAPDTSSR